jgi:hypothetical protein
LAEQFEQLARGAKTDAERREFQTRAALWERLADARLENNECERSFAGLRRWR